MQAENTYQVYPWLWSSGQLSVGDIAKLPAHGIEMVINLAPPTSSNALSGEAELVANRGISYIQIPVAWEQPTLPQLRQFFALLEVFEGHKIWVHCAKNMRASAFIYLYRRIGRGENEHAAAYPLREIWTPNEIWQAFMRAALEQL